MVSRCKHCNKVLALNKTAWASKDGMYCSEYCGITDAEKSYEEYEYLNEDELKEKATAYFHDVAEEISREDYGARTDRYTACCSGANITFTMEDVYEGDELISTECIGWVFGNLEDEDIEEGYVGNLKATYVD